MRCPFCKSEEDRVIDTRASDEGAVIRRRRECLKCAKRFTTHERLEEMPVRVVKKSERREPFDRGKILNGLLRAVEKRPVSMETVEGLVNDLERELLDGVRGEISTREIGEQVMRRLREVDEVAYVRFASVYREYQALSEFIQEIQTIGGGAGSREGSGAGTEISADVSDKMNRDSGSQNAGCTQT